MFAGTVAPQLLLLDMKQFSSQTLLVCISFTHVHSTFAAEEVWEVGNHNRPEDCEEVAWSVGNWKEAMLVLVSMRPSMMHVINNA